MIRSTCPYCGVGCGIVMEVAGSRVVKVHGNKRHPTNFGRLCTKGSTCSQAIAESGRLEHAYAREDRSREPARIPIDEAIRETARRLRDRLTALGYLNVTTANDQRPWPSTTVSGGGEAAATLLRDLGHGQLDSAPSSPGADLTIRLGRDTPAQ